MAVTSQPINVAYPHHVCINHRNGSIMDGMQVWEWLVENVGSDHELWRVVLDGQHNTHVHFVHESDALNFAMVWG